MITDMERVLAIIESLDTCAGGVICDDCPLKQQCYGREGKTVGKIALEYLRRNHYLKGLGRKVKVVVEVCQDGKPLMTCMGLSEAQKRTGYCTSTISSYAKNGKKTSDGLSFVIVPRRE